MAAPPKSADNIRHPVRFIADICHTQKLCNMSFIRVTSYCDRAVTIEKPRSERQDVGRRTGRSIRLVALRVERRRCTECVEHQNISV